MKPKNERLLDYIDMNHKVIIRTNNLRFVGYRTLFKIKDRTPNREEKKELFFSSSPVSPRDNFLGEYEPVPDTFDIIDYYLKGEPEGWEKKLLTKAVAMGRIQINEGRYFVEEL